VFYLEDIHDKNVIWNLKGVIFFLSPKATAAGHLSFHPRCHEFFLDEFFPNTLFPNTFSSTFFPKIQAGLDLNPAGLGPDGFTGSH